MDHSDNLRNDTMDGNFLVKSMTRKNGKTYLKLGRKLPNSSKQFICTMKFCKIVLWSLPYFGVKHWENFFKTIFNIFMQRIYGLILLKMYAKFKPC